MDRSNRVHPSGSRPRWQSIFRNPRELRAGWRLLLFIVVSQVLGRIVMLALTRLGVARDETWRPQLFLVLEGVSFGVALVGALVMARFERRSLADYGLGGRRAAALLAEGSLFGLLAVGLIVLGVRLGGGLRSEGLAVYGFDFVRAATLWLIACIGIGLSEEFLFRGYAQFTLGTGMGFWRAAVLMSLLFGGVHYFLKPNETWVDGLSVTAIALFLCLTLRRTGSLWWAIGFHAWFDYAALVIFAAPNTGNDGRAVEQHLLDLSYVGPAWLTGGHCGLEASVLAFPVLALCVWVFGLRHRAVRFPLPSTRS